jgi:hypothetical protein
MTPGAQPASGRETEEVRVVLDYLHRQGILARRTQAGKVRKPGRWIDLGPEHWPDITLMLPDGIFCVVEMKRQGDRASYHRKTREGQEAVLGFVNRAGAVGILARGADEAIQLLSVAIGRALRNRERREGDRRRERAMMEAYEEAEEIRARWLFTGAGGTIEPETVEGDDVGQTG